MYCTLVLYVPSLLSDACFFLSTSLPNASTPPYSNSQFKKAHTVMITPNLQNSLGGQYEGDIPAGTCAVREQTTESSWSLLHLL